MLKGQLLGSHFDMGVKLSCASVGGPGGEESWDW